MAELERNATGRFIDQKDALHVEASLIVEDAQNPPRRKKLKEEDEDEGDVDDATFRNELAERSRADRLDNPCPPSPVWFLFSSQLSET
ncbi:hypothetical protein BM221_003574 [Beauveria bassiana]|uniref:Uncharacterized protein n=1 Tax=Beauveria bassiana TaxID=176275 RepID=A0A2N6NV20_BEABA|nr:hypothetical protein BM221_003574 [Beauveria bassiana]